jgi:hypothetical protein
MKKLNDMNAQERSDYLKTLKGKRVSRTPDFSGSVSIIRMSDLSERGKEQVRKFGRDWIKDFDDASPWHMLQSARLYYWEQRVIPE